jgi:hypothetical protein
VLNQLSTAFSRRARLTGCAASCFRTSERNEHMTTDTTGLTEWQHAARIAATICEADWDALQRRLPAVDGYLPGQLTAAAARLRDADTAADEAIGYSRAAQDTFGSLSDEHRRQLEDVEETLAVCGYVHPSRVQLFGDAAQRAVAKRHEARAALAELLFTARTVLDDAHGVADRLRPSRCA